MFVNSQTRPLHANEENQATRKGTSPLPFRRMKSAETRLALYDALPDYRKRLDDAAAAPAENHNSSHLLLQSSRVRAATSPLGPLGFNFSQHGPTTRPSRKKDCRESIYLSLCFRIAPLLCRYESSRSSKKRGNRETGASRDIFAKVVDNFGLGLNSKELL